MSRYTVVYDACVLYPAPLRDLLMHLALMDLFRAKWTEAIHDEWIRSVLANNSHVTPEHLQRTRQLMNVHVRDCLVTDYEHLIESVKVPDRNDRHVVAAAIKGHAQAIVTFNLRDFPVEELAKYSIEAIHPDEFIHYQIGLSSAAVCLAAKRHRASLKNPPKTVDEYLACLIGQGLPQTCEALSYFAELI